jgi:hypothetical protein
MTGSQRALAEGGSDAGVGIGDDVARGEDTRRGRAQVAVDDDRARPVEVELAGHRSRARPASDLHHDTSGPHPHPFSGRARQRDLLEVFGAVDRLELPTGEVRDALLAADLVDDVVARREPWCSVHELHREPRRASSSASSVALSPPPITTTSSPANWSGRDSIPYVTSPPNAPFGAAASS